MCVCVCVCVCVLPSSGFARALFGKVFINYDTRQGGPNPGSIKITSTSYPPHFALVSREHPPPKKQNNHTVRWFQGSTPRPPPLPPKQKPRKQQNPTRGESDASAAAGGSQAIFTLARRGDLVSVRRALELDADPNIPDTLGPPAPSEGGVFPPQGGGNLRHHVGG